MRKTEQQIVCILLERLLDRKLITQKIFEDARAKVLDTWEGRGFFLSPEPDGKEGKCGYSSDSCPDADGQVHF